MNFILTFLSHICKYLSSRCSRGVFGVTSSRKGLLILADFPYTTVPDNTWLLACLVTSFTNYKYLRNVINGGWMMRQTYVDVSFLLFFLYFKYNKWRIRILGWMKTAYALRKRILKRTTSQWKNANYGNDSTLIFNFILSKNWVKQFFTFHAIKLK